MKKNQKGFTLVELIVVIAIVAILSGIAVPTYVAYINEAHKAADIQLASDVGYSIKVASAAPNHSGIRNGDYIVITTNGTQEASGANDINDASSYSGLANAIYGDFGALVNGQVKLQYDKWGEESQATSVVESYNNSSFKGNEEALLGDVQQVTNVFKLFLDENDTSLAGTGFNDYLTANNITDGQAKANAAALYVASRISGVTDEIPEGGTESEMTKFKDTWSSAVKKSTLPLNLIKGYANIGDMGALGAAAAGYAMGEAMVQYLDKQGIGMNASGDAGTLPEGYASLSQWYAAQAGTIDGNDADAVYENLASLYERTRNMALAYNAVACNTYYNVSDADGKTQADKDAEAFIATMNAINESSSLLLDDLDKENMYSDGTVYQYLTGYLTAGDVLNNLPDEAKSGAVVIVAVGADDNNAAFDTVCYPLDFIN